MNWNATRFDLDDYSRGIETIVWEKELGEYLKTIPHIKLDKPCNHFWYPRQLNLFD